MGQSEYSGRDNLEVMREAINYNRFLVNLVSSGANDSARIVDFGAGSGTFAKPMSTAGRRLICVETDPVLAAMLSDSGIEVIDSLDLVEENSVDFIYSLNVLEHISDDRSIALSWFRKLRPGGRALAYVPAFQSLYTSMDRKVGHVRRYSRTSLCDCLTSAGFQIDEARYADSLGVFATLAYKAIDTGRGDINPGMLRTYDRWIFPVSLALDRFASRHFGKNVYVLAVKPETGATPGTPA